MSGVTWSRFAEAATDLAATGRGLLERSGTPEGLLATVRDGTPPRIHPVIVGVVEGRLLTFVIEGSPKERDLLEDGRYALHAHQDPAVPHELLVRGRAVPVADPSLHAAAAAAWPFDVADGGYRLFELGIEHVLFGERPSADAWPPRYRAWRPASS
ncbi:MAG: pyridoxamine 5'-phosphate oxidase [Chloroflexota bacterium]